MIMLSQNLLLFDKYRATPVPLDPPLPYYFVTTLVNIRSGPSPVLATKIRSASYPHNYIFRIDRGVQDNFLRGRNQGEGVSCTLWSYGRRRRLEVVIEKKIKGPHLNNKSRAR